MGLIDDILKGIPENALLRQKLLDIAALQAATETENAILKDDLREAKVGIAERDNKIAELEKRIKEFTHGHDDPASIALDLAAYLRKTVKGYGDNFIKLDLAAHEINRSLADVSANLRTACEKIGLDLTDETATRATVRKRSGSGLV